MLANRDGRVALYLAESLPALLAARSFLSLRRRHLQRHFPKIARGATRSLVLCATTALLFSPQSMRPRRRFSRRTVEALWELVWAGRITNDTFYPAPQPRCALMIASANASLSKMNRPALPITSVISARALAVARRTVAGRSSSRIAVAADADAMERQHRATIIARHGIVMRETAIAENIPRGYNTIYPALKTMEESGWVRRGMFVAGMGAAQFATARRSGYAAQSRAGRSELTGNHFISRQPIPRIPMARYALAQLPANPKSRPRDHSMARAAGAAWCLSTVALRLICAAAIPPCAFSCPDHEPDRSQAARDSPAGLPKSAFAARRAAGSAHRDHQREHRRRNTSSGASSKRAVSC